MPPSAGVMVPLPDRVVPPRMIPMVPMMYSKHDAHITWFRTEFAAANAIIDALCDHLYQLEGGVVGRGSEYESVFSAIHSRRCEWIPIINRQKYNSVADVELELRKVASKKCKPEKNLILQKVEEVTMSHSEKGIFSETSDRETAEKEIVSENSEKEVEISEKETVSENSENGNVSETVSENSEKEIVSKNSEKEAEISEKETMSENENFSETESENCDNENDGDGEVVDENAAEDDSPESEITETGK